MRIPAQQCFWMQLLIPLVHTVPVLHWAAAHLNSTQHHLNQIGLIHNWKMPDSVHLQVKNWICVHAVGVKKHWDLKVNDFMQRKLPITHTHRIINWDQFT